jgi:hypothetical protein
MQLSWDDIALHTILSFEAQVRYGTDETWRTVGVMREWAAADAIALTAAPSRSLEQEADADRRQSRFYRPCVRLASCSTTPAVDDDREQIADGDRVVLIAEDDADFAGPSRDGA